jgi:hypothetical protein
MSLFYYPNRPHLVPPDPVDPAHPKRDFIDSLEAKKIYVAERKWNGDNIQLPTDTMEFWNRYAKRHRYEPSPAVLEELNRLPKKAVFNLELVNYRIAVSDKFSVEDVKDLLIVHACMVWNGRPLLGKTWGDSRTILENEIQSGEHVKVSEIHRSGFWDLFQQADGKRIEGIILKDPTGLLVFSTTPGQETTPGVAWMLKIRKPRPGVYLY